MAEQEKKEVKIIGVIEKILFKNEDNHYHVLSVEIDGLKNDFKVTISQPNIFEGLTYEFKGLWSSHSKYGKQFQATFALERQPSTKEGLRAYLQSSFFSGIGPVIANRIVNHFGEDVIKILNEEPDRMMEVPGIAKAKLSSIKDAWEKNKEINDIMLFLQTHGISTLFSTKIYEYYGRNCVNQILTNPYKLSSDISGIGFSIADKIALKIGFAPDSQERIKAVINYMLEQSSSEGHCYLLQSQVSARSTELLKINIQNKVQDFLNSMERSNELKVVKYKGEEPRYYARKLFFNETYCAEKAHALKDNDFTVHVHEDLLNSPSDSVQLSKEQLDAVTGVIGHGISVLTGGPGCGKTTTTKKIVDVLYSLGKDIVLAAPTGRAAQRMTEVIGREATTIHRLLSWDPINGGFLKNENNPIGANFIIIDESSMLDINLAAALLRATPHDSQILFIGDADQLPPVGPGNFFKDLIASEAVPVYKLNKIFRQGKESLIIKYAHEINSGEIPVIDNPLENPSLWTDGSDCVFIDSGLAEMNKDKKDYPKWSSLRYGLDMTGMIIELYTKTIPKYLGKEREIQILIPMNIGEIGTIKINSIIQSIINPQENGKGEIKLKERTFRDGDKVIQTKNNYDLGVFNGDIGRIVYVYGDRSEILVRFSEDREVIYKKSDMFELELAYAISIHKSQGSEFDCVILPIMTQYSRMLFRNLVYTGLTRAKKFAIFVGQRKAMDDCIKNISYEQRQTSLKTMLNDVTLTNPLL